MASKVKLIVTADDYGVLPEIDKGIIDGIQHGIVNTVTVVVNFRRCKSSLRDLIQMLKAEGKLNKVGIGLHLNITMGKPVTNHKLVKTLVNSNRNFYTNRVYQGNPNLDRFEPLEIRREAMGQMQRFIKHLHAICQEEGIPTIPIDHVTSHFNLFHSVPMMVDILAEMCEHFKQFGKKKTLPLPVRRPMPAFVEHIKQNATIKKKLKEASAETKGYIIGKNLSIGALFYKSKWLTRAKLKKVIDKKFEPKNIRCAHSMYFCFYASKSENQIKIEQLIGLLRDLRKAAIKDKIIKSNEPLFLEVVHHLARPISKARLKKIKISGFDKGYLKKFRPKELSMLKEPRYTEMFRIGGVGHGLYSDMKGNGGRGRV